jgi:ubiquinone/menaquinone biosynthesis C-methylase UbiE
MAQISEFVELDRSDDPQFFVDFLDLVDQVPQMKELRVATYRAMHLSPGDHVLDVGCGIGTVVAEMSDYVGSTGRAVGLDISSEMIAEAQFRNQHRSNVVLSLSPATAIGYRDKTFDAVRMERVLLHVPDRKRAMSEAVRVTKPGGRLVIVDLDVDSVATFSRNRDRTRRMTALIADSFVHSNSGRELPSLFRQAGLQDISVDFAVVPMPLDFCLQAGRGALLAAAEKGLVNQSEVDAWYSDLVELDRTGEFFQSVTFTIVSGTVV